PFFHIPEFAFHPVQPDLQARAPVHIHARKQSFQDKPAQGRPFLVCIVFLNDHDWLLNFASSRPNGGERSWLCLDQLALFSDSSHNVPSSQSAVGSSLSKKRHRYSLAGWPPADHLNAPLLFAKSPDPYLAFLFVARACRYPLLNQQPLFPASLCW